jgi:hypothetical protein
MLKRTLCVLCAVLIILGCWIILDLNKKNGEFVCESTSFDFELLTSNDALGIEGKPDHHFDIHLIGGPHEESGLKVYQCGMASGMYGTVWLRPEENVNDMANIRVSGALRIIKQTDSKDCPVIEYRIENAIVIMSHSR